MSEFTEKQEIVAKSILQANKNLAASGQLGLHAAWITQFIPAQDGVNVYVQFSDGRLWFSNDCYLKDHSIIPVNEGPAVDV